VRFLFPSIPSPSSLSIFYIYFSACDGKIDTEFDVSPFIKKYEHPSAKQTNSNHRTFYLAEKISVNPTLNGQWQGFGTQ